MISAIVTSLNKTRLMAAPLDNSDIHELVGRKARYLDKSGRIWPAKVVGTEDQFLVVSFDDFPTGLGQGQILDIMEDGEEVDLVQD